jgi:alkylhydroperoxidase family enzyme
MARLPYPDVALKGIPLNVLKLFSYSAATAEYWTKIGAAQFRHLALTNRNRELVILLSTSKFQSSYEWTHHITVSNNEGVTDAQRVVLAKAGNQKGYLLQQEKAGQIADLFTPQEKTLLVFLEAVIDEPKVGDDLWARAKAEFSDREIVEIITLQVRFSTSNSVPSC